MKSVRATLTPFALLTPRLIILPTPFAVKILAYRALYSRLHSLPEFCTMAFGTDFPVRERDDAETEAWIGKEVEINWNAMPLMGDFAVGLFHGEPDLGKLVSGIDVSGIELRHVQAGDGDYEEVMRRFEEVRWVGYAGVRDATRRLPPRCEEDPKLPPWQEMIELRYGFAPEAWGKGFGTEAARGLMLWAEKTSGVRRFIAETEKENIGSGKILGKLGFKQRIGNEYWKDPLEIEWERHVP